VRALGGGALLALSAHGSSGRMLACLLSMPVAPEGKVGSDLRDLEVALAVAGAHLEDVLAALEGPVVAPGEPGLLSCSSPPEMDSTCPSPSLRSP